MVEQIKNAIEADATLGAIVGTRVYQEAPIEAPSGTYLEIRQSVSNRTMVDEERLIKIVSFSIDLDDLENLNNALISFFEDKHQIGTDFYYKIYFLGQSGKVKLENGFYFSINTFVFKKIT